MKVAILSESPADEAAIRVLVEGILGSPINQVQAGLRARGWPNVAQILPAIVRHLYFNTTAEGLVVVVDSGAVCGIVAQADIARTGRDEKTAEVVKHVSVPTTH